MAKFVKYGDKKMPVEEGLALDDIKAIMARHFPELSNPKVETIKNNDSGDTTYVFSKQAGQKGAHGLRARKDPMEHMVGKLDRLRAATFPSQEVIEFLLERCDDAGEYTPEQLRNMIHDLEAVGAQVKSIGERLVRLPTAAKPSGSVL